MRIRLGELRRIIRGVLLREFGGPTGASGTDPTKPDGFYPYEIERGADIHGFWYKSPGRPMGGDGDPFRPDDAAVYIGQKPPSDNAVNTPGEDAPDGMPADELTGKEGTEGEAETPEGQAPPK
jgi:hypothetical protein